MAKLASDPRPRESDLAHLDRSRPGSEAPTLGLLALLVLIATLPAFRGDGTWQSLHGLNYDFDVYYYGLRDYYLQSYGAGHFPLWFSPMTAGLPFLGLYLSAAFSPALVLLLLEPVALAVKANAVVQLELIALFTYLAIRAMGRSRPAALVAALWNALSGYFVWISPLIVFLAPGPWFLMWIWAATAWARAPRLRWWLLQVAALALLLTSGDVEALVYSSLFGGVWVLLRCRFEGGDWRRRFFPLVLGAILALLIASPQLLPSILYFARTPKTAPFSAEALQASFHGAPQLAAIILAMFAKRAGALFFCLGALPFIVLGLKPAGWTPPLKATVIVAGAILLIYGAGHYGAAALFSPVPLLGSITSHYKIAIVLQPFLTIIVAFGVEAFLQGFARGPRRLWPLAAPAALAAPLSPSAPAAVLLGAVAIAALARPGSRRAAQALLVLLALAECAGVLWAPRDRFPARRFWSGYALAAREAGGDYRTGVLLPLTGYLDVNYLTAFPIHPGRVAGELGFDSYLSYPPSPYARLLAAIEPGCFRRGPTGNVVLNFSIPFKTTDFITPANRRLVNLVGLRFLAAKDFALREADDYRILFDPELRLAFGPEMQRPELEVDTPSHLDYDLALAPNHRLRFGLGRPTAPTGDPAAPLLFVLMASPRAGGPKRLGYARVLEPGRAELGAELEASWAGTAGAPPADYRLEFAALSRSPRAGPPPPASAKWIDPRVLRPEKTIRRRLEAGRLTLFENLEALPRARVVHRAIVIGPDDAALDYMKNSPAYDPGRMAVIDEADFDASALAGDAVPARDRVDLTVAGVDELSVELELGAAGLLVVSENHYPGWRAWVDGKPQKLLRADFAFKALALDPGRHRVRMRYLPSDFRIGLFIFIGSTLSFIFALATRPALKPSGPTDRDPREKVARAEKAD